jgi:hypothetical protein
VFLQAAFNGADFFPNATLTANEQFIASGIAPADLVIHSSGHCSFFCQGMSAGGSVPRPFRHAPDGGGGWNDQPASPKATEELQRVVFEHRFRAWLATKWIQGWEAPAYDA